MKAEKNGCSKGLHLPVHEIAIIRLINFGSRIITQLN